MNDAVHPLRTAPVAPATASVTGTRSPYRVWPLRKPAVKRLAISYVVLLAVWSAAGLLYMWLLDDGPLGDLDRDISRWFEDHRTERMNTLAEIGSGFSDTLVKVILVALVGTVMVVSWRRWHDGVFLATLLIFEASVFAVSSIIVGRERPPVQQLEDAAPSGSFPSGHSAAAVAFYVGLFVIFSWHTRNRLVRTVFGVMAVAVPIMVATARTYMGMHHTTDVLAGMLLGAVSIVAVRRVMQVGVADIRDDAAHGDALPPQVLQLDLVGGDPHERDTAISTPFSVPSTTTTGSRP